jgi:hypothetical protein
MRTRVVMKEHNTERQHSTPFVLNGPTQFFNVSQCTSDVTAFPCCMNPTISTPFVSKKTIAISFLAGRRLFKLSLACLVNVCAFTA